MRLDQAIAILEVEGLSAGNSVFTSRLLTKQLHWHPSPHPDHPPVQHDHDGGHEDLEHPNAPPDALNRHLSQHKMRSRPLSAPGTIAKREWSGNERRAAAQEGVALPDGSFPIATSEDLFHAIQAIGRAHDYLRARRHIIERAEALGLTDQVPSDWLREERKAGVIGEPDDWLEEDEDDPKPRKPRRPGKNLQSVTDSQSDAEHDARATVMTDPAGSNGSSDIIARSAKAAADALRPRIRAAIADNERVLRKLATIEKSSSGVAIVGAGPGVLIVDPRTTYGRKVPHLRRVS